jgi:hypothetical protein
MTLSGTTATGPDLGILANYGVLGLFTLILLGFGLRAWQREIGRADRLENELREQHKTMVERVIPALVAATAAMEESAQITRQIAEERERELRRRLNRTEATE